MSENKYPKWTYHGKEVIDIPYQAIGFTYIVEFNDGTKYVGKKLCRTTEKKPSLKNGKPRDNHLRFTYKNKGGKRVPYEVLLKSLNWRSYIGSFNKSEWSDNTVKRRSIISYHSTRKGMAYAENHLLYDRDVLIGDEYRNGNIGGSFYKKDIEEVIPWKKV